MGTENIGNKYEIDKYDVTVNTVDDLVQPDYVNGNLENAEFELEQTDSHSIDRLVCCVHVLYIAHHHVFAEGCTIHCILVILQSD